MPSILVVDDSMVIRKMLNKALESDYSVSQAENGQEGLTLFEANSYDLLITDINMPIMNGFELIEKVRTGGHEKKHLPIIVLSTEFSDDVKAKGRELGVNAWMVKPTEETILKDAVKALLAKANA